MARHSTQATDERLLRTVERMVRRSCLTLPLFAFGLTGCATSDAGSGAAAEAISPAEWAQICKPWDDWDTPAPPFRIHGDTWYVGTCGITALLVETSDGLVLLDSGTEAGAEVVLANIRSLGHNPHQLKLILPSHEHFDHVGGFAKLRAATGATIVASLEAKAVFVSGKADPHDPQYGMHDAMVPVEVGKVVADGETVSLGGTGFTAIATPGHTPGALSWQWESCAGSECRTIVYADSLSPVSSDSYRFSDHPAYLAAYRTGLDALAALDCDILLTPHPSASEMVRRAAAGSFHGANQCKAYSGGILERLDARLAQEASRAAK